MRSSLSRSDEPGRRWGALATCLLAASACAADSLPSERHLPEEVARALGAIRGQDIVEHARLLSDGRFAGREAGTPGVRKAAGHVAGDFRSAGLLPGAGAGSYFRTFKIRMGYEISSELEVRIGGAPTGSWKRGEDYMPVHLPGRGADVLAGASLVGYGISVPGGQFDEYAALDVRGRVVLAFSGVPWTGRREGWSLPTTGTESCDTLRYKARNAADHGAACLLIVDDPSGWRSDLAVAERLRVPDLTELRDIPIPVVHVTRELASNLTALSVEELRAVAVEVRQERAAQSMMLRGRAVRFRATVSGSAWIGRNVIGVLPGRDESLKHEAVVIGAHYDHIGEGPEGINFGANDNAAGVGALIAAAGAFRALARPPRRTVVFAAFDAEEIGRLGSKDYVARPPLSIRQTVLMVNFDMIGRNEPDHIYAVGTRSSPELHRIHQQVNRHVGLRLTHPASFRLGRSDHSPFYFASVPILYLFGGIDADYNSPRDTWDKLSPAKVERVARLAFLAALQVAERTRRITFFRDPDALTPPMPRSSLKP